MIEETILSRALSLSERFAQTGHQNDLSDYVAAATEPKIKWWSNRYFQRKKNLLRKHVGMMGGALERIGGVLNESRFASDALYGEIAPYWCDPEMISEEAGAFSSEHERESGYGFEALCAPLFSHAMKRMVQAINALQAVGLGSDSERLLAEYDIYFSQRLANLMLPSMAMEANLFRIKRKNKSSQTPEERFGAFVGSLGEKENQRRFWGKYPVLWRLVSTTAANTINASVKALERLAKDKATVESSLGLSLRTLQSIHWGTGDAHCGGHVVAILHFAEGILVYKPRSLAADVAYNALINWFASCSDAPAPKTVSVLDCGTYGYCSFVEANTDALPSDIPIYYKKLGSLLAISWLLGITDLHHENLIASGGDPYLVDVEVMFDRSIRPSGKSAFFQQCYLQAFEDLLFRTGLLPYRLMGPGGVYDLSAIGACGEQPAPTEALMMENIGRDDARFVMQKVSMPQEKNIPYVDGIPCRAYEHLGEIIAGFESAISTFKKHRVFLLGPRSILNVFRSVPVRYVTRNTRDYVHILQSMAHPSVLGDAVESDMMIGGELWAGVLLAHHLESIIPSEVEDLWNGDVPYFWTTPDSKDIFSSTGRPHKNFFACTGMQSVKRRLRSLEKLLVPQTETIRMALKSTMPAEKEENPNRPISFCKRKKTSSDELIYEASKIGQSLLDSAYYVNDTPIWSGLLPVDKESYTADVPRLSLYDGTPGIGLFMGQLYKQTRDERFKAIATDALATIRKVFADRSRGHGCGAFNGIAGLIYADSLLSDALNCDEGSGRKNAFAVLERLVKKDESNDLIYGAAGVLLVAMGVYRQNGSTEALQVAAAAADRLAASSEKQEFGVTWKTVQTEEKRLGGLSHGVTGIAWALAEWAQYTKEEKWTGLAQQAFAYEQSFFDEKQQTWVDARGGAPTCHWCYGAPGIGLALLKMPDVLGKDFCDERVRLACEATWKQGLISNQCLCHGNLGNSEIFLATGDHDRACAMLSAIMADYRKKERWDCDMPGGATTPGLMCGMAGIGYGLLRHADPERTPNILALELS